MNELSIVDSHVHWWEPALFKYSWLDGLPALNRAFLPAEMAEASATAKVGKLIFVECGGEAEQGIAEVDWVSNLAKEELRLKGIIARASLEKGKAVRAELTALARRPLVKGVRRLLQGEREADFLMRPEFVTGIEMLGEFGFTFDLCIRQDQLRGSVELVRRVPQVMFVLNHFGKPEVRSGRMEPWAADLKALAELPNVVCKLSGLATEADWRHWQAGDLKPYFERALECFGFDRVLFGGDWPVATLATSYDRWVETVRGMILGAKKTDWIKVFQTNAERIYHV
ncbi:MAG: amidohydrolase 2 [Pedosphaera sp.]|nr:amidohydrolase 2 [Pedosphaera sp.]